MALSNILDPKNSIVSIEESFDIWSSSYSAVIQYSFIYMI